MTVVWQLEHPHLVGLLDYYHEEDCFYLVQELMRGGELRDHILDAVGCACTCSRPVYCRARPSGGGGACSHAPIVYTACAWCVCQGGYTERIARQYVSTLVSAVKCMHDAGIVHRDIKVRCGVLSLRPCVRGCCVRGS